MRQITFDELNKNVDHICFRAPLGILFKFFPQTSHFFSICPLLTWLGLSCFTEQRNTRDCHLSVQYYYPCQPRTGLPSKNPLDPMLLNFNDQMEDGKSRKSSPEFWIVLLTGLISSLPRFYLLEISCISAKTFFSFSKQPIPNQKRREVKSVSPFKIIVSIH